jgi:hypothetical protein
MRPEGCAEPHSVLAHRRQPCSPRRRPQAQARPAPPRWTLIDWRGCWQGQTSPPTTKTTRTTSELWLFHIISYQLLWWRVSSISYCQFSRVCEALCCVLSSCDERNGACRVPLSRTGPSTPSRPAFPMPPQSQRERERRSSAAAPRLAPGLRCRRRQSRQRQRQQRRRRQRRRGRQRGER